jgi:UDP-N-acetyl-D-galactosamine dehydrogenase
MGAFVADAAIKEMVLAGKSPKTAKIAIFGLTFKENCPDTRNSKVEDIIIRLKEYGISPMIVDPWASERDAMHEYGVTLTPMEKIRDLDCLILAVAHNEFRRMSVAQYLEFFRDMPNEERILLDVKGILDREAVKQSGIRCWRL